MTTGLRFHPLEILISPGFKSGVVLLLGVTPVAVLLFEVLLNATSMFYHGNIRKPAAIDGWLRLIVVTPDMHRVHHSVSRAETGTNFAINVPWWDRLLGRYRAQPGAPHETMTIGVGAFRRLEESAILRMLTQPFRGKVGRYPLGHDFSERR
ncbi:MAG: sterol desaturase family protein [Pseudomonadales bacterium]